MKLRRPLLLLVATLALCLVALPPFIATLELHHQLGEADEDGHQHSAADLCSWVQSHASSSVTGCVVVLDSQPATPEPQPAYQEHFVHHLLLTEVSSRGPPSPLL
jgi:hypothetical protein